MTKVTTKFVAKGGKHTYMEIPKEKLQEFSKIVGKYKFLLVDGKKYEFAGSEGPNGTLPVFQEVQMTEIKVAQVSKKELPPIEETVKKIGIKSPLKEKVLEIIEKGDYTGDLKGASFDELTKGLYPKDKAKLKVLWFTAKRDALIELAKFITEKDRPYVDSVKSFLNKKITEGMRDHSDFPEPKK
jgi:hypothetical protein